MMLEFKAPMTNPMQSTVNTPLDRLLSKHRNEEDRRADDDGRYLNPQELSREIASIVGVQFHHTSHPVRQICRVAQCYRIAEVTELRLEPPICPGENEQPEANLERA